MTLPRFVLLATACIFATLSGGVVAQMPGHYGGPPGAYDPGYAPYVSQSAYAQAGIGDSCCPGGCTACGIADGAHYDGYFGEEASRTPSVWGSIDYLMWWEQGRNTPPLVSTGVLPAPILFGGERIGQQMQSGGRVDFGTWFDGKQTIGIGVRVTGLEGTRDNFTATSTEFPALAQPFFNIAPGVDAEDVLLIGAPGLFQGDVLVRNRADYWASEGYFRVLFDEGYTYRVDLIGGYHYARLDDQLVNRSFRRVLNPAGIIPVGTTEIATDLFDIRNEFNGGTLGFRGEKRRGIFTLEGLAKLSVGRMHQQATIRGFTVVQGPPPNGDGAVLPGGLFAQRSNINDYARTRTTWIPEVGLNLGVDVTCRLKATFGYTALWFSDVVHAGDQIDRVIDPRQKVGIQAAHPAFAFRSSDHWLQGINFGLSWDY